MRRKSQERVGPGPNQWPLPSAAFAMANTDYDSLRVLRMCTSANRQEAGWTITGTVSEKGQGVPWEPPDWWAKEVSNLRPPACKAGALPLSYSPVGARMFFLRRR